MIPPLEAYLAVLARYARGGHAALRADPSAATRDPSGPRRASRQGDRVSPLVFLERPALGEPRGLLVLHHGRGTDESDLLLLGDAIDPGRRLHVVTPRAPLALPGSPGYHWYAVPRVGYPDPASFHDTYAELAAFHDELWQRTGIAPASTVLGGFSMGTVMSYALGLGDDRPPVAGIIAFSGFIPIVEDWEPALESRQELRVFIAHGRRDPVIDVALARRARDVLLAGGLEVEYHESDVAHNIDATQVPLAADWADRVLATRELGA